MPRNPEPSGHILAAWELARIAEREQTVTTTRCMWCKWHMTGTVRETREAYAAHRTDKHPERKPKKQLRRKRLFGQFSSTSDLRENIANARQQGGATWAGERAE